jgi:hypothetical protein
VWQTRIPPELRGHRKKAENISPLAVAFLPEFRIDNQQCHAVAVMSGIHRLPRIFSVALFSFYPHSNGLKVNLN